MPDASHGRTWENPSLKWGGAVGGFLLHTLLLPKLPGACGEGLGWFPARDTQHHPLVSLGAQHILPSPGTARLSKVN